MMVHRDEDAKSEASSNMLRETISTLMSIFQSIKQSEDIVDAAKSKVGSNISPFHMVVNL